MLDPHAVELDDLPALAVIRAADLAGIAAGHVEALVALEARSERHKVIQVLHAARQHVEQVARDHVLFAHVLRVDERRRAGDRDGLFEGADLHLGIHVRGEPRRQVDAFRLKVLKLVSVNVTVYRPGRRSTMLYRPSPSVTTLRTFSMSAGLEASTVTPGSTPPDASLTTPAIPLDDACCADAGDRQ